MPTAPLSAVPTAITAGTAAIWRRSYDEFPASVAGNELKFLLAGRVVISVDADADGDAWLIHLTSAASTPLLEGLYAWEEQGKDAAGNTITLGRGQLRVRPNLATAQAGELEDPDERDLRALKDYRLGKITDDIAQYTIDGTEVRRYSLRERMELEMLLERRIRMKRKRGTFSTPVLLTFGRCP